MKVVILAGGLPSAINDEPDGIPKPMLEIGERPLLWHIMKNYAQYGFTDFIICAGYKADLIKQYFLDYYIYESDITIDLAKNSVEIHNNVTEPWSVTVLNTGLKATTAERVRKVKPYIEGNSFIVCYGDCLSDIHVDELLHAYEKSGRALTAAVAKPAGRNQILNIAASDDIRGSSIPEGTVSNAWVNACTMVADKRIFDYMGDAVGTFETDFLNKLAQIHEVSAYHHNGFWSPVETVRDRNYMQSLWDQGKAPWKTWNG